MSATTFPFDTPTPTFPYRVLEHVGTGSMGMVYRALEEDLDRTVAIKTMRQTILEEETPEVQEEMRRRFLQEARAAAQLSHSGATTVYRVGQENGLPFMVMEWLDGRSLDQVLKTEGTFSLVEASRLVVHLLEALDSAHRAGVVHRDVKPSNLVLLKDGRLKVTDFGIAQIKGRELVKTRAGVVLATPQYASPEQLRGGDVDGRSDLFSVGVLLYHLLCGRYPFEGDSFMQLAGAILTKEPRPLTDWLPEVPPEIDIVLRTALQKDRRDRFADAAEMAQNLRLYVAMEDTGTVPTRSDVAVETRASDTRALDLRVPETKASPARDIHTDLPGKVEPALAKVLESWPSRALETQPTEKILSRLLERPLHAPAFAGAVRICDLYLLIEDGVLLGAINVASGICGDAAVESLPESCQPFLHPLPELYPQGTVGLLATLLHPPKRRQANLDTSIIQLPALAQKLRDEGFGGLLRIQRGTAWGTILFHHGEAVISLYSEGWDREATLETTWYRWLSDLAARIHVDERNAPPLAIWYRQAMRNFAIDVHPLANDEKTDHRTTSARLRQLFHGARKDTTGSSGKHALHLAGTAPGDVSYELAPAFRLLGWLLDTLPAFLAERDKTAAWKYLAEWTTLVGKAWLYHDLPRPDSQISDFFDVVTADAGGKVLHLAHRVDHLDRAGFQEILDRAREAKKARFKTGDIGAMVLVAPHFDDDVLETYARALTDISSSNWLAESLTGYDGFVRMGARRGFHLLLVEERDDELVPLLAH